MRRLRNADVARRGTTGGALGATGIAARWASKGAVMGRGMSLHIGLNSVDPEHYQWDGALAACEFDATDMEALVVGLGNKPCDAVADEGRNLPEE